jgi:hypothetical protein
MSWEDLAPPVKVPTAKQKPPMSVYMFKMAPKRPARLGVVLRADILDLLPGDVRRFRVQLGKADNKHQLRIACDAEGRFEAALLGKAKGGGWFRFLLAANPQFPDCRLERQEVRFKHDKVGKALLIDLPAWAWDARVRKDVEADAIKRPGK